MSWRASCSFRVVADPECERCIQSVRGVGPVALDEGHEPARPGNELRIVEQVMFDARRRSDVRKGRRPLSKGPFAPGWTTVFVRRLGVMQSATIVGDGLG